MSRARPLTLLLAGLGLLSGCGHNPVALPGIQEANRTAFVQPRQLEIWIPATGLVLDDRSLELTIEAQDTPKVAPGQPGLASGTWGEAEPVPFTLRRVLRHASGETGQTLVWTQPLSPCPFGANDFVMARIRVAKRTALAVPRDAILVKDGRPQVLRRTAGKDENWVAVPVSPGAESGDWVEIRSGLAAGDEVLTQGALGYLDPDFKSAAGD